MKSKADYKGKRQNAKSEKPDAFPFYFPLL